MEYMFRNFNSIHADEDTNNEGCHKFGDLIQAKEDGAHWGGDEMPAAWEAAANSNKHFIIKTPGESPLPVVDEWRHIIDYTIVGQAHDTQLTDGYRLDVFEKAESLGVSGQGALRKAHVENFLTQWNCSIVSFAANQVRFDFGIYLAVTSEKFWETDVDNVVFGDVGYDQGTGLHSITADYSGTLYAPAGVERNVVRRGGTVISHNTETKIIEFDINRSVVTDTFKQDIKDAVEMIQIRRSKYYVSAADVATVQAAGGCLTITGAQFLNKIKNKVEE